MNHLKRKITLLLAVVMTFFLSLTAFAQTNHVINPWSAYLDKTLELSGFIQTETDSEGYNTFVIEPNSFVTFNFPMGWLRVEDSNHSDVRELVCNTISLEKATRTDNEFWYNNESKLKDIEYIKSGAKLQFITPGTYVLYFSMGYNTRDERIAIQKDESNLAWQYSPSIKIKVNSAETLNQPTDKPTSSNTTPTVAKTVTATPTSSKVIVNGKQVSFDAYTINDNNYFKLRDVAQVLRGSEKQFNVTWDGAKNAINLISNEAYKTVGGELKAGDGKSKTATLSTSTIYKDGVVVSLTAYTINDNNYFKLRDLGAAFDFEVTWDGKNNTIIINTKNGYTAE